MILVIGGRSCTGKTAIAQHLANAFRVPIRSCGAEVRAAAGSTSLDALDLSVHRSVDRATRAWVLQNESGIVEGRFLGYVLAGISKELTFLELHASDEVRCERLSARCGQQVDLSTMRFSDSSDDEFCSVMYDRSMFLTPAMRLCTANETVESASKVIRETLPWALRLI